MTGPREGIQFRATLDTRQFNRGLSRMERRSKSSVGRLGSYFKGVTGPLLGIFAAGAIAQGVGKVISDFQEIENVVRKATGASGEALAGLVDQVRNVAEVVPGANEQLAAMVGLVATEFPDIEERVGELTTRFAEYERVVGGGEETVTGLSRVIKQFGVDVEDAQPVLDGLTKLQQDAAVEGDVLLKGLQRLGPSFTALGLDVSQGAAQIASFEQRGIAARRSASLFDAFLLKASSRGVQDYGAELRDVIARIEEADTAAERMGIAVEATNGTYGALLVTMVETGAFVTDELVGSFNNAEGATTAMATATLTVGERVELLGEKLLTLLYPAIEAVVGGLETLIGWVEDGVTWLQSFGGEVSTQSGGIRDTLQPLVDFLQAAWEAVQRVFAVLVEEFRRSWPDIQEFLVEFGRIAHKVFNVVILPALRLLLPVLEVALKVALRALGVSFRLTLKAASSFFRGLGVLIDAGRKAAGLLADAWQAVSTRILAVWRTIQSGIQSGVNFVIDLINKVIDGVNAAVRAANVLPGVSLGEVSRLDRVQLVAAPAVSVNVDMEGATVLGSDLEQVIDTAIRTGAGRGLTNSGYDPYGGN